MMNVIIEFFDEEPIENLITCLHYKVDKVIYFGYGSQMSQAQKDIIRKAQEKICDVKNVEFVGVSSGSLSKILEVMEMTVAKEEANGNQCFYDLTGGGDLILVAMGILSTRRKAPMHAYDVEKGMISILNQQEVQSIQDLVPERKVELTLDHMVSLYGGTINYGDQKLSKSYLTSEAFIEEVDKLWQVAKKDQRKWNGMSAVLKCCTDYEVSDLAVEVTEADLERMVKKCPGIHSLKEMLRFLAQFQSFGVLESYGVQQGMVRFSYKNEKLRDCLLDAGCLLELRTYFDKKHSGKYSDVRIGVHIEWDYEVEPGEENVKNEIDVLALEGNIPHFISCKNGRINQMALYELETVAERFGGRYAKKELVTSQLVTDGHAKRAEEMGILITKPQ